MKKLLIVAVAIAALVLVYRLGWTDLLTLDALKAQQAAFAEAYAARPVLVIAAFFAVYVAVTAASIPGAVVLTLAAGALFGLVTGLILVSFASSIGATLAFLASRTLFRDWVLARFGDRLKTIDAGVAKDGAFYLFTLRLVPVFPFFLINLVMGLTSMRVLTFYAVSQAGMLAGTLVYVNAGTQLAAITSLGDIASPQIIGSLAALGLLPWFGRAIASMVRRRRVYAGWTKPKRFDRNLIVIGGGSAGLVAAYIAATVKAKVTLVESHKLGGDCLNFGCVPSKALLRSAKVAQQMRDGATYGLRSTEPEFSFREVMARVRAVITAIEPHDSIERFTGLGVDVVMGHATLVDPWTVEIREAGTGAVRRLTSRATVIAAGGAPFVPPLPGMADSGYVTSDTLWDAFAELDHAPRRMVVMGGGPIGCELAQAFARLGSEVTLVEMAPRLLLREDADVSALVAASMARLGIRVLTGHTALRCEQIGRERRLVVAADGGETDLPYDALLVAVGRSARLTGYGLEALGIETDKTITTNDWLETRYPNIYAAGDVAGPYQFTHVASHQAWYASVNALFGMLRRFKADYRVIPWTTFTDPEVARVGLSEAEATERGIAHEVTVYHLDDLDRAIADSAATGFVKILTAPGKDRILGATIVGEHAGELLAEFVLAMKHGLGLNKLLGTIHTYPTWAEANKYAAGEWKRAHAPEGLLRLVGRFHDWMRG